MHILSAEQFDREYLENLFSLTQDLRLQFENNRQKLSQRHSGKQMALLFYEPSTRTRLSFAHGALHMGMTVASTENARDFSSAAKGETIEDTIRVLNQYRPDLIVIRHHETGAAAEAAAASEVPILNAGDGKGGHPTQSLLYMFTIFDEVGRADNLKVVLGGDLLHGRTVRSLAKILGCFEGNHIIFNSVKELQMADDIKQYLTDKGVSFQEVEDMKTAFEGADVVYWTRLQKERLPEGVEIKQTYVIDQKAMSYLPKNAIVMHPLPRVGEITAEVDSDPRSKYFEQAGNGMWVRMALIDQLLSKR